jgi:hypothetical protein
MQAELKKRHGELSGGRPMVQNPTVPTPSSSDLTDHAVGGLKIGRADGRLSGACTATNL